MAVQTSIRGRQPGGIAGLPDGAIETRGAGLDLV